MIIMAPGVPWWWTADSSMIFRVEIISDPAVIDGDWHDRSGAVPEYRPSVETDGLVLVWRFPVVWVEGPDIFMSISLKPIIAQSCYNNITDTIFGIFMSHRFNNSARDDYFMRCNRKSRWYAKEFCRASRRGSQPITNWCEKVQFVFYLGRTLKKTTTFFLLYMRQFRLLRTLNLRQEIFHGLDCPCWSLRYAERMRIICRFTILTLASHWRPNEGRISYLLQPPFSHETQFPFYYCHEPMDVKNPCEIKWFILLLLLGQRLWRPEWLGRLILYAGSVSSIILMKVIKSHSYL